MWRAFCQFPVTVRRKAHNGWTSIKGGQIHSTTIITIDSFLRGRSRLPVLLTELSVGCLNIKARVLNAREVERQREGEKKSAMLPLNDLLQKRHCSRTCAARWERRQQWNSCAKPFPVHKCHVYFWSPGLVCTTSLSNKMVGVWSWPERR